MKFFFVYILLVSDLISALFLLIHEGLHYKCYMSLIWLQQLLICVSGKQNYFQRYRTKELSVHALRHMTALYLMLLMYNTNDQKMACIMLVVQGEEMCSISDPQTSQKLIVLCYTFIFSFHVRCLFELNTKHMKKGNALQNLLGIHFTILPNVYLHEKTRKFLTGLLKPG